MNNSYDTFHVPSRNGLAPSTAIALLLVIALVSGVTFFGIAHSMVNRPSSDPADLSTSAELLPCVAPSPDDVAEQATQPESVEAQPSVQATEQDETNEGRANSRNVGNQRNNRSNGHVRPSPRPTERTQPENNRNDRFTIDSDNPDPLGPLFNTNNNRDGNILDV